MIIALIAAVAENNVIGLNGALPWKQPIKADWDNLHKVTAGAKMIMGRKSYEDENRLYSTLGNYVLSRNKDLELEEGFTLVSSLKEALKLCHDQEIVWVLGGQAIFEEAILIADKLVITHVKEEFLGDTFFPEINPEQYRIAEQKDFKKGKGTPYDLSIITYLRK